MSQQPPLDRAAAAFRAQFDDAPQHAASAPGRVNLIGEHTDYNEGFVLPMGIEHRACVVCSTRPERRDNTARVVFPDLDAGAVVEIPLRDTYAPLESKAGNYVLAVMTQFIAAGREAGALPDPDEPLPAFDAALASDVPLGGGLSSSAAIEVATFTALQAMTGVQINPIARAQRCQRAEHLVGVPCGIMDQLISSTALPGAAMLIDCRSLELAPVPLNDPGVSVLVTNSNVKHDLADGAYAKRRAECEAAVAAIRKVRPEVRALRDATMDDLAKAQIDDAPRRRARHVIGEDLRTRAFAKALQTGDLGEAGRLMVAAHESIRDDYEVSCKELDLLVELASGFEDCFGARMTGGGFGGCTVSIVKTDRARDLAAHLAQGYEAAGFGTPSSFVTRPAAGARFEPIPA